MARTGKKNKSDILEAAIDSASTSAAYSPGKQRYGRQPQAKSNKRAKQQQKAAATGGLQLILPDETDPVALAVIAAVDAHFGSKAVRTQLQTWATTRDGVASIPGMRVIQGGRFEVFVRAGTKPTDCFDTVVQQLLLSNDNTTVLSSLLPPDRRTVEQVRLILLTYSTKQAKKDPRIGHQYEFDNFSLLINYEKCDAQYPHIDLLGPNVQCGLVLTDKSPGTIAYTVPHNITTVDDIRQHLWPDLPDSVAQALQNNEHARNWIAEFGLTLYKNHQMTVQQEVNSNSNNNNSQQQQQPLSLLPLGSLLTLPGSHLHAGPKSTKYRCILFFSGWRRGSTVPQYHPDMQYFGPLLIADLIAVLFDVLTVPDRLYLLYKLDDVIRTYQNLYRHLNDPAMSEYCCSIILIDYCIIVMLFPSLKHHSLYFRFAEKFTKALAWGQYGAGGKKELMETFARGQGIVAKGAVLKQENDAADPDLVLASVQGLHVVTNNNNNHHHRLVQVYRFKSRPGAVQLYFPEEDSYQGAGGAYSLELTGRSTRKTLFDGSNGILRDDEGNVVECCVR